MSHNIGTVGMATTLVGGGEFVVHTPHDVKRTLDRIIETRATFLLGVPTHAIDLVTAARQRGLKRLGKIYTFQLGGSPIPPATMRALIELGVKPQNSFGMTENCSFQYTRPDDPCDRLVLIVGQPQVDDGDVRPILAAVAKARSSRCPQQDAARRGGQYLRALVLRLRIEVMAAGQSRRGGADPGDRRAPPAAGPT